MFKPFFDFGSIRVIKYLGAKQLSWEVWLNVTVPLYVQNNPCVIEEIAKPLHNMNVFVVRGLIGTIWALTQEIYSNHNGSQLSLCTETHITTAAEQRYTVDSFTVKKKIGLNLELTLRGKIPSSAVWQI